mmetsp:Transcript_29638/g.49142  ORF Transcript_29638/g.49142 Transcript_29638/m.49142 type:complete len:390 (+) Transcript_29638:34-1203(+)
MTRQVAAKRKTNSLDSNPTISVKRQIFAAGPNRVARHLLVSPGSQTVVFNSPTHASPITGIGQQARNVNGLHCYGGNNNAKEQQPQLSTGCCDPAVGARQVPDLSSVTDPSLPETSTQVKMVSSFPIASLNMYLHEMSATRIVELPFSDASKSRMLDRASGVLARLGLSPDSLRLLLFSPSSPDFSNQRMALFCQICLWLYGSSVEVKEEIDIMNQIISVPHQDSGILEPMNHIIRLEAYITLLRLTDGQHWFQSLAGANLPCRIRYIGGKLSEAYLFIVQQTEENVTLQRLVLQQQYWRSQQQHQQQTLREEIQETSNDCQLDGQNVAFDQFQPRSNNDEARYGVGAAASSFSYNRNYDPGHLASMSLIFAPGSPSVRSRARNGSAFR